ncbi:hypothetical protein WMF31_28080 [Sorangium sp. So ce1036]|uniref:hypothetical protein n=1 Tax=Sorangium sp. So ce1036 TaxID=3133328 RepID=UPI003F03A2C1
MRLDPERAMALVSQLDAEREPRQRAASADEALSFLLKQLEQLRDLANGYPRNPVSGAVWSDGRALTLACDALTEALAGRSEAARAPITLNKREINRQGAKDAKNRFSPWRLGGSNFCTFQGVSTRLSL